MLFPSVSISVLQCPLGLGSSRTVVPFILYLAPSLSIKSLLKFRSGPLNQLGAGRYLLGAPELVTL
jgi:hypothetical protein